VCALAALFTITAASAQQIAVPQIYRAEFIKTKPGKLNEYKEFINKNLEGITRPNIKAGKLMTYGFSQVFTPTGTAMEHDCIGLYGYSSWDQLEPNTDGPPDYVVSAMKSLGFQSPKDYTAKRDPLRDIVRAEIWRRVAGTTISTESVPKVGDWIVASYIKALPGKSTEYENAWKTYSLPLQEDRVKAGKLKSYTMWSIPGSGTSAHYDHVTFSRPMSFKDIGAASGDGESAADRVHKGKDWRQMRREMQNLRTIYRAEIIQIKNVVR
jgi:hypothetical protein